VGDRETKRDAVIYVWQTGNIAVGVDWKPLRWSGLYVFSVMWSASPSACPLTPPCMTPCCLRRHFLATHNVLSFITNNGSRWLTQQVLMLHGTLADCCSCLVFIFPLSRSLALPPLLFTFSHSVDHLPYRRSCLHFPTQYITRSEERRV
jgi:hypothetical protein